MKGFTLGWLVYGFSAALMAVGLTGQIYAADPVGNHIVGTYTTATGDVLRYFSGIYDGDLTKERITAEAGDLVRQLRAANKTAEVYLLSNQRLDNRRFHVKYGQVLVMGWYNETQNTWGWLAVDNHDDTSRSTPTHRIVTSNGERDSIVGVAFGDNAYVTTWYATNSIRDEQRFEVQASAGWIRFYFPD